MDDINFDELDKAVNSALKHTEPQADPTHDSRQEEAAPTVYDRPAAAVPVAPRPESASVSPQKPRGQFMDMVHPSSDMIKQQSVSPRPSRQAATLQPLNPAIVETSHHDQTMPDTPNPKEEIAEPTRKPAANNDTEPAIQQEWSDSLDATESAKDGVMHTDAPAALDESATLISEIADQPEETGDDDMAAERNETRLEPTEEIPQDESSEPQSPFIKGTELEKRPLGAFADAPAGSSGQDGSPETDEATNSASENVQEELPAVPIPEELTPEVVSVESDDMEHLVSESNGSNEVTEETPSGHDAPGMAASISPQYSSAAEPDEQGDHPVFDTRDYHQPLTPPKKKGHAGLVTALVLVVLALLGACAWYAITVLKLI